MEAVGLITKKGYSIAEASRNLGIDYSVLRRWKNQVADDPQHAFPGKTEGQLDNNPCLAGLFPSNIFKPGVL